MIPKPLLLLTLFLMSAPDSPAQILDDFEGDTKLGDRWAASGKVQVSRNPIPAPAPKGVAEGKGPGGNAIRVRSTDRFAVFTKVPTPDALRWKEAESVRFWIYQEEDKDGQVHFLALEPDRKAMFFRRCVFSGSGWHQVELPLSWFRWEKARLPQWEKIAHFGVRGAGGMDFWIDHIELVDSDPDTGAHYSPDDLTALAFPDIPKDALRSVVSDRAWVIGDAPDLDAKKLHGHLIAVRDQLEKDVPRWKREEAPTRPPRLLVFKDKDSYKAFFERFGEKLSAKIAPPSAGGYHVMGVATSYWDEKWGTLRPVYTHEFVHSCATFLGLQGSSGGDWFQEGMANLYQLRNRPQPGISKIIQKGLATPGLRSPIPDLCSGDRISSNHYWQALTLIDFLMRGEAVREKFDVLLETIESTGSSDLRKHIGPVYGMEFEELEAAWETFAKSAASSFEPKP